MCSSKRKNTDVLQNCFSFPCDATTDPILQDLWISNGVVNACGTFIVEAAVTCAGLRVFVNGDEVTVDGAGVSSPLQEGESFAMTVDDLESIQVVCTASSPTTNLCKINFCLTLHYECC